MLYDKYKSKIQKIAKAKNTILFFRFVFLSIFVLIVLFSITFISSKGRLKKGIEMPSSINYGENYEFSVKTFFNGGLQYFEYREENSNEWTKEKPTKVGTYYVRAVTSKFIGNRKSAEYKFSINKVDLNINVTSDTITYGSYPEYSTTGLINRDRISEITFAFDSYGSIKTNANINLDSVKVTDVNGLDVTNCYNVTANGKEIEFKKKAIEINPTMDSEIVYSGEEVKYLNTYTINTELGYSDIAIVEGKIYDNSGTETSAILPGRYTVKINKYEIKNNNDITTPNYSVETSEFNFNIIRRSIVIETGEASKQYDGTPLSNNSYSISQNSQYNLVGNDKLKDLTETYPSITYYKEDGINNTLNIRIYDKDNNDVTDSLYNVSYRYGKLSIIKRNITIKTTTFDEFVYAKDAYGNPIPYSKATLDDITKESGSLADGDEIRLKDGAIQPSISEPGKVKNEVKYYIGNSTGDVTDSYNITRNDGYLIMYSKNITIKPIDKSVVYGNFETLDTSKCFEFVETYTGFEADIYANTTVEVEYYKNNQIVNPRNVDNYEIRIKNVYTSDKYEIHVKENAYATLEITKRNASVRLNSFDSPHTYDGNKVTYSYGNEMVSNLVYGDSIQIDINYYKSNGTMLSDAPINVGDYYVDYKSYVDQNNNSNNYNITSTGRSYFSISKRYVKLVPDRIDPITYNGNAYDYNNETFTVLGDGLVLGDVITATYSINGGYTPKHAGTYTLYISDIEFNNSNATNYTVDYSETVELTINPIKLVVEFNMAQTVKEYDGNPFTYYGGANNFNILSGYILTGDTISLNYNFYSKTTYSITTPKNVGKYLLRKEGYTVTNSYTSDYEITCEDKDLEITKRFVEIKPKDMTIEYGDPTDYNLGFDYISNNHFLSGDVFNISVSYVGLDYSHPNAGSYKIIIDGLTASSGVEVGNYDIKYAGTNNYATLTITKKILDIALNNINSLNESTYNGSIVEYPSNYFNYNGDTELPFDERLKVYITYQKLDPDTLKYVTVSEMKDAGTYRIIFNDYYVTNDSKNNYIVNCSNTITYRINKKNVNLSLRDDQSMIYGDIYSYPTTSQYIVIDNMGFVGSDYIRIDVKVMKGSIDYTNDTNLLHVGEYDLVLSSYEFVIGNHSNYSISIDGSTLLVNKRNTYITYSNREYTYNGSSRPFDFTHDYQVSNLANGDKLSITAVYYNDPNTIAPINAGSYVVTLKSCTIVPGIGNDSDYNVIESNYGIILINKKEVRLGLNSYVLTYGSTNYPTVEYSPEPGYNFVTGDSITITTNVYYKNGSIIDVAISKLHVGEYDIKVDSYTFNGSSENNYVIKPITSSTLTISPRPITIRLNNEVTYEYDYDTFAHYYDGGYTLTSGDIVNGDILKVNVCYKKSNITYLDPINAGTYVVEFVSCTNGVNYQDYDVTCTNTASTSPILIINKIEVVLSLTSKSKTYDGKTILAANIATTHDLSSNIYDIDKDEITISFIYKDAYDETYSSIKNVGKYYIYISSFTDASGNYTFNGISNDKYYEIEKREVTIKPYNIPNRDYNGEVISYTDKCIVTSGSMASGEAFKITVEFRDSNNIVIDEPKDAGTYTIYVKDVIDTLTTLQSNYEISYDTNSFTINKKNVSIKPKTMSNAVYRNQAYSYYEGNNNFAVVSGQFYNNDEVNYSLEVMFSQDGINPVEAKNAGTYYVIPVGINGSNPNYNVTYTSSTTFTIEKYTLNVAFKNNLLPNSTKEYDGDYRKYGNNDYGNCTFTQPTFETIEVRINPYITDTLGNSYTQVKDYGTYTMHLDSIIVKDSNNYKLAVTSQYEFKITKKEVHIEINDVDESYGYIEDSVLSIYANGFNQLDDLVNDEELTVSFKFKSQNRNGFYSPIDVDTYKIYMDNYYVNGTTSNNYNIVVDNDGLVEFTITPKRLDIYASSSIYEQLSLSTIYDKNNAYSDDNVLLYCDGLINSRNQYNIGITKVTYYSYDGVKLNNNPIDIGRYYVIVNTVIISRYGHNVTSNYDIHNEYDSHKTLLEIVSEEITVTLKSTVTEIYYGDNIPNGILLDNSNATVISAEGVDYINQTLYSFRLYLDYYTTDLEDIITPRDYGYYNVLINRVEVKYNGAPKDGAMFNIILSEGTRLHINKRVITIKATTGNTSDEKYYDGNSYPVTYGKYDIYSNDVKYTLPYDETLTLNTIVQDSNHNIYTDPIIDAGTYYVIVDESSESLIWSYKASNYDCSFDYSTITIKKARITAIRNDNPYSEDDYNGENIDQNSIINQFVIKVNGSQEYNHDDVVGLKIYSSYNPFDPITYDYLVYNNKDLNTVDICNAGKYVFTVYDFVGDHDNYELAVDLEVKFTINRIELSITTGTKSWEYDGTYHSYTDEIGYEGGLLENHRIAPLDEEDSITKVRDYTPAPVDNVIIPYIYDIDRVDDPYQGDVTYNYIISISKGKLSITKKDLNITLTGEIEYTYNGSNQSAIDSGYYSVVGLVSGETISITLKNPVKDAGYYADCEAIVKVNNKTPDNYNVIIDTINVMVYKVSIDVTLNQPKDYYFNNRAYTFTLDNCGNAFNDYKNDVRNVEIEFTDEFGNPIDNNFVLAGSYNLKVSNFKVKNSAGVDRTHNFNINISYRDGDYLTLVIDKPIVRVSTFGASKLYDGTPLMNLGYNVNPNDKKYDYDESHGYYDQSVLAKYGLTIAIDDEMDQPSIIHPDEMPNPKKNYLEFKITDLENTSLMTNFTIDYVYVGDLLITNIIDIYDSSYGYIGENVTDLSTSEIITSYINGKIGLQNVRFEVYDYAIFYNEDYSEFDIDYELCDVWEELGAYRIVLLDFRIYSGDIDITESIKDGTNILNGGNTHTFDDEEYPYVCFTINKIDVSIAPKSQTLTRAYNGERLELTEDFYRILDGSILVDKGHILVVGGNDYLEGTVGNKKVQFDQDKIKVVVRTGSGMEIDVTKYYNIKSTYAEIGDMGGKVKEYMFTVTLIITKKTVNVVMPTEEEYFYSGISLHTTYEGPSVLTDDPEYNIYLRDMTELVDGHYIYITNPENSNSNKKCTSIPNQLSNKNYIIYDANGNDVTKNYVVNSVEGKLIVKPSITITFKSASAEKVKDGEPLTCPEIESITIYDERNDCYYTWDEFASITGFEYATSKWASEDKVGKYENTFNVDFYNSSGAKITPVLKLQYGISVEKEYGELWIKRNL